MAIKVDIKELLEAGAHFGHKSSRWHPKMAQYIHTKRGGVHIIDLEKTLNGIEKAVELVEKQVAGGRQVLFVGTKRQAQDIVKSAAESVSMPYVSERWFGGMLTNNKTISGRIKYLKDLESKMQSGELAAKYNKLEIQRFQEEIDQLNLNFGGIKDMAGLPGVVFVTDVINDQIAIKEANRLGIPVVGIVDTNANPAGVDMVIPANDDAIGSISLIISYIVSATEIGKKNQKQSKMEKGDE